MKADWHKEDIKAALRKNGTSLAEIARQKKLAPSTIYNVFKMKYPRVELLIANELGLNVTDIWPSRYE